MRLMVPAPTFARSWSMKLPPARPPSPMVAWKTSNCPRACRTYDCSSEILLAESTRAILLPLAPPITTIGHSSHRWQSRSSSIRLSATRRSCRYPGSGRWPQLDERGEFQQWHIVADREHPFLDAVIKHVRATIAKYTPSKQDTGKAGGLRVTAPTAYTPAIQAIRHKHPHR